VEDGFAGAGSTASVVELEEAAWVTCEDNIGLSGFDVSHLAVEDEHGAVVVGEVIDARAAAAHIALSERL
jgi:hypothetical protein